MAQSKTYIVNIDMRWSHDIRVTAKNKRDAKTKAFKKFRNNQCKKQNEFNIYVDEV